jgi:hypothetical protein
LDGGTINIFTHKQGTISDKKKKNETEVGENKIVKTQGPKGHLTLNFILGTQKFTRRIIEWHQRS